MEAQFNPLKQLTQSGALNVANPMKSYQNALAIKGAQSDLENAELDREAKTITIGKEYLRRVKDKDEYPKYRDYMVNKLGVNSDLYPETFASDEEFENWRIEGTASADAVLKAKQGKPFTISKVNEDGTISTVDDLTDKRLAALKKNGLIDDSWKIGDLKGTPYKSPEQIKKESKAKKEGEEEVTPTETPEQKLNREKDLAKYKAGLKTPTTAMAAFLDQKPDATPEEIAVFAQQLKGKGVKITLPDGTVMELGGGDGSDLTPKTKGAIEEKIMGGKEQYARINAITNEFKPEYQEVGTRLSNAWTGIKSRMGSDVSKEDAQKLSDFKKFQRKSIENINLYIKELTGAQMSEKEANRLRLAQPDPGEKWYNGDDPITFKAKMDDIKKTVRASVARYEYYRSKGFEDKEIKKIINSGTAVSLEDIASKMR